MTTWEQKLKVLLMVGTLTDITGKRDKVQDNYNPQQRRSLIAKGARRYKFEIKPQYSHIMPADEIIQWNKSVRGFVHLLYDFYKEYTPKPKNKGKKA